MTEKLKVSYRRIEDLIPYARNARTHSADQVARIAGSIKEFGWTNPILVDGENGIIAGHGRLAAARKLGMSEVPVIELDGLSDVQKRAYIIADNKMALDAGWDDELLKIEFEDLKIEGYDLDHTGFSEVEIGNVLNGWDSDIPELDEDGEPDIGSRIVLKIAAEDEAQEWQTAEEVGGKTFVDFIVNETHTCYEGNHVTRHAWGFGCGKCPACRLRAEGFKNYEEHR